MQLPSARRNSGRARIRAAIETLETRQMLSSYFVDTDVAFAALNSKDLNAGDVVLLKGGTTFHGRLYLDSADAGTSTNPVLITSYDPSTGKQIAAGAPASARATISSGNIDGIFAYNVAGLSISGINVVGSGANSNTGSGLDFYTDKSGTTKLDGINIDHVDVSGYHSYGISLGSGVDTSGYSNVSITYVEAHDNGSAGITSYGVSSTSSNYSHKNIYIGHVNAYNNAGFANNSPSGSGIVLSEVDGATIEYSTAYNNGANNLNVDGPVGIWVWDANNVTIQYSESYNNRTEGGGFDLDGGVTNSVMQYNYSHDNAGSGFGLYQFSGARVWANNTVRNNVSSNNGLKNGATEISIWNNGTAMTNAMVYGNTLVVSKSSDAILLMQSSITASVHDNVIQIGGVVDTRRVGVLPTTVTTPVVSTPVDSTPVTTPVTDPVTTPVVSDPVVTAPVVTDPVVTTPVATTPTPTDPAPVDTAPVAAPVTVKPVVTTSTRHHRHKRYRA